MGLLEQILVQADIHIQWILAAGLLCLIIIEEIHVIQLRKVNRRLAYASQKLTKYFDSIFADSEFEEEEESKTEIPAAADEPEQAVSANVEIDNGRILSKQENDMRTAIAQHKKQKNDTQLLDMVLQEIFD